jgi:hypothetical protein
MGVIIPFKRGDTFIVEGTVRINGVAQNITGWTIRSKAKVSNGTLVQNFTVQYTSPATGVYRLVANDTTAWPIKDLECDIEYLTSGGQIVSTETFTIQVAKDITDPT